MPYEWTTTAREERLKLWPHQSMTARGFSGFIGATAAMLTLPLFAVLGSAVLWVLLAFFAATIWGVWHAIMSNRAARKMHEELRLTKDEVHLEHVPAKGPVQVWNANPSWVTIHKRTDGPVEDYLTLRGGGREVELGAFLTPEERETLYDELQTKLRSS